MERLHSELTVIWKYIFPWTIIGGLIFFFFLSIIKLIIPLTIGLIIVGIFVISLFRNLLMNLKFVYIDRQNKQIIIKEKSKNTFIPITNINRIEKLVFSLTLLTIKLKEPNELGSEFTFLPKDTVLGWCPPEKVLNELIDKENNETVGNIA